MSISLALLVGAAVLSEVVRTQEGVYKYPIHRKKRVNSEVKMLNVVYVI